MNHAYWTIAARPITCIYVYYLVKRLTRGVRMRGCIQNRMLKNKWTEMSEMRCIIPQIYLSRDVHQTLFFPLTTGKYKAFGSV